MSELSPIEWAVRPLKKYAVFSGRAPRAEYWWFYLATVIVQIPLTIVDEGLADWSPLSSLFSLVILLPWLAVSVRRLHDINRTGWWLGAFFILIFVVAGAAVAAMGDFSGGETGPDPSGSMLVAMIVGVVGFAILGITIFVFTVTAGTEGPNDYGPDPYGRDNLEEVFA